MMTMSELTLTVRFVRFVCCMLSSLMLLGVMQGALCVAQDITHSESPQKIKSWLIEPGMTQEDEDRIIQWIKSSPKATSQVSTVSDFADALRATVPKENPFEISINLIALEERGLSPDTEIFADSVSAGSSLLASLRHHDLAINVINGKIEITSHDAAEADPHRRVYDVTCLLTTHEIDGKRTVNCGELLDSIQYTIEPDHWEAMGGTSTIIPILVNQRCLLVVSATSDMHLSLQSLLDGLAVAGQITTNEFKQAEVPLILKNEPTSSVPASNLPPNGAAQSGGMF